MLDVMPYSLAETFQRHLLPPSSWQFLLFWLFLLFIHVCPLPLHTVSTCNSYALL